MQHSDKERGATTDKEFVSEPSCSTNSEKSCDADNAILQSSLEDITELANFKALLCLSSTHTESSTSAISLELQTTPLLSWAVKQGMQPATSLPSADLIFTQYGLLGQRLPLPDEQGIPHNSRPVLLNVATLWSAFICGSRGRGKSHSLSCMLENCLMPSKLLGKLPQPLAGIVFHYDATSSGTVCEAAHLSSEIPVTVLVSPSNIWRMKELYSKLPNATKNVTVQALYLEDKHLNTSRMLRLMAFSDKDTAVPLYMEV